MADKLPVRVFDCNLAPSVIFQSNLQVGPANVTLHPLVDQTSLGVSRACRYVLKLQKFYS